MHLPWVPWIGPERTANFRENFDISVKQFLSPFLTTSLLVAIVTEHGYIYIYIYKEVKEITNAWFSFVNTLYSLYTFHACWQWSGAFCTEWEIWVAYIHN